MLPLLPTANWMLPQSPLPPALEPLLLVSPPTESSRYEVNVTRFVAVPWARSVPFTMMLLLPPATLTIWPAPTVSVSPSGTVTLPDIWYTMAGLFQDSLPGKAPLSSITPLTWLLVTVGLVILGLLARSIETAGPELF